RHAAQCLNASLTGEREPPPVPANPTKIAIIALGAMGLPMATHLATSFSVTGFDPYEQRRQLAAEHGIATEATPRAASNSADIALLAVRDHGQAESALFNEDGVL